MYLLFEIQLTLVQIDALFSNFLHHLASRCEPSAFIAILILFILLP